MKKGRMVSKHWQWGLLALLALLAVLAVTLVWPHAGPATATAENSITRPDTGGNVGRYTSLALDGSGYPVVSYYDWVNKDLKVMHCNDPNCTGEDESIESPDTGGRVGRFTSLALDWWGYPVVSYYDDTNGNLKLLHCGNSNCTAGNSITSPDTGGPGGNVGGYTSLALRPGGYPVVSYYDWNNGDLKVLYCNDPNCSGAGEIKASPDTGGPGGNVGQYTSLALSAAGLPVISYFDWTNFDLKVLYCADPSCTAVKSTTSPDTAGTVGRNTSLALDAGGNPVVSYYHISNAELKVLYCGGANCSAVKSTTSPETAGNVGWYTSLALDGGGNPVISYYDWINRDLKVMHCNDPNCDELNEAISAPDTAGNVGTHTSLALDDDGYPVVSYYDASNGDLKVMHCNDVNCMGGNESITRPDTGGDVGWYTSLALDASGYPVVSYFEGWPVADLKVLHCNDANCSGGDESITSPDTGRDVGRDNSLALDSDGNPVVSYRDRGNGDLKVLHCNDPNCAGLGESITSPDTGGVGGDVGGYTSLALDAGGHPVVSYYDWTNGDLKLLHCNDPDCDGGDESITTPDTGGEFALVGWHTSLALDSNGYPVVSYFDAANGHLKLLHCNDPNCSGFDDSKTSPDTATNVGYFTSLALDASGYPVVSYYDAHNDNLKVLHCNDPNCAGGGESITSPDTVGDVGKFTSLALDRWGNPVVSYWDKTNNDLKVLYCGDPDCAAVKSITSPDTGGYVGRYTSLALVDEPVPIQIPVVSYYDWTNGDLKLLHCSNVNCTGKEPTPTPTLWLEPPEGPTSTPTSTATPTATPGPPQINITNLGQYALPKTCFEVWDPTWVAPYFTVCDNDFQVTAAGHEVCVPDGICEDEDPADGRIRVTVAPAHYGVQESKAPPNHTALTSKLDCDANFGKCELTFVNEPESKPWFPWDINGDGIVDLFNDVVEVIDHIGQTKP